MLPVAYRVIKGFATFFGVVGVISCIGGIIGGIIANDNLKKNKTQTQGSGQQQLAGNQTQVGANPAPGVGGQVPAAPQPALAQQPQVLQAQEALPPQVP